MWKQSPGRQSGKAAKNGICCGNREEKRDIDESGL